MHVYVCRRGADRYRQNDLKEREGVYEGMKEFTCAVNQLSPGVSSVEHAACQRIVLYKRHEPFNVPNLRTILTSDRPLSFDAK